MSRIGFIQDLIRGVDKVLSADKKEEVVKETVVVQQSGDSAARITAAMDRGFMALEDSEWNKAVSFFDQVLSLDAKNARAYYGMALAKNQCKDAAAYIDKLCAFTPSSETMELPIDEAHIREAAEKYAVSGYLSAEEIKKLYDYKPSYQSTERSQKQLNENARSSFEKNRELTRARQFATGELKTELEHLREILFNRLDEAAQMAEAHANKSKADAERNYQTFLASKDMLIVEKKREAEAKCKADVEEAERQRIAKEKIERAAMAKKKFTVGTVLALAIAAVSAFLIYTKVIVPGNAYKNAEALFEAGDSAHAAMAFVAAGNYKDARTRSFALWAETTQRDTVTAGGAAYTVGLKADGTVVAVGHNDDGQCYVSGWTDIVAVDAGVWHTVGLKADGTVVAAGSNYSGKCNVSDWTDIVAVAAASDHTVGLKADGTVVAVGFDGQGRCDVSRWKDIVAVAAGEHHTVGLKADGTVVTVGYNNYGQCNVSGWANIVDVDAGSDHTVCLKADGTVVAFGYNKHGQCDVSGWKDIVAVAAGEHHTVGLKANGTVVAVGDNDSGQCDVSDWKNIVAIAAGGNHTVGLKADGTVVAVGSNKYGECDVSGWTNIKLPHS